MARKKGHGVGVEATLDANKTQQINRADATMFKNMKHNPTFLYAFAFITVSLSSGLVYGYPQLREALIKNEGSMLSETELGVVYTIGSWSSQGGGFFIGIARDKYGTRIATIVSLVLVISGCFGLAVSNENDTAALGTSLFLLGIGTGSQLCVQPVAYLFEEKWQGTILSSFSGAYQVSSLMFLIVTNITSDRPKGFGGLAIVLLVLLFFATIILPKKNFTKGKVGCKEREMESSEVIPTMTTSTTTNFDIINEKRKVDDSNELFQKVVSSEIISDFANVAGQNKHDEDVENHLPEIHRENFIFPENSLGKVEAGHEKGGIEDSNEVSQTMVSNTTNSNLANITEQNKENMYEEHDNLPEHEKKLEALGPEEQNKNTTAVAVISLIQTWEYFLLVLWFSIQIIPLQYYIGTIGFQLERKGDDSGMYVNIFTTIYATSSILSPALGKIADIAGLGVGQLVATILSSLSLFILSINNISLNAHIIGMVAYSMGRMALFGMFFTNIGKRFGFSNYGTLAGLGLLISAICSLLQFPLIALAADGNEQTVNMICGTFMFCTSTPYCIWLRRRERREQQQNSQLATQKVKVSRGGNREV